MTQRPIGHLDADCFYASAERVRDERLLGVPVGVLGNQGACVIARSYEMRADGVGVGMPIWEALPRCPEGVYIKRDFRWYQVLSDLMLAVAREFSARVEYYSIDECFFEVRGPSDADYEELARRIRDRVMEVARVPVTVGIAASKTLAKLVSDTAKPFGAMAVLGREAERALLASYPITEVAGIAGRRARRLAPWGIATCLDFALANRRRIRSLLTAHGEALWWELNGEPVLPIRTQRPPHKTLARGGSFGTPAADPATLFAWLVRNLERLIAELEYHGVCAGRLDVWVAYRGGQVGEGRARLEAPSDRFDRLLDAARACLRAAWRPREAGIRMDLIASDLVPRDRAQLGLFDPPPGRDEALARVKHAINARHGPFALRSGATLPLADVYRDAVNSFDICDIRGKLCF